LQDFLEAASLVNQSCRHSGGGFQRGMSQGEIGDEMWAYAENPTERGALPFLGGSFFSCPRVRVLPFLCVFPAQRRACFALGAEIETSYNPVPLEGKDGPGGGSRPQELSGSHLAVCFPFLAEFSAKPSWDTTEKRGADFHFSGAGM
jgi:hypothetical protein